MKIKIIEMRSRIVKNDKKNRRNKNSNDSELYKQLDQ